MAVAARFLLVLYLMVRVPVIAPAAVGAHAMATVHISPSLRVEPLHALAVTVKPAVTETPSTFIFL